MSITEALIGVFSDDPINWLKWGIVFAILIGGYIIAIPLYGKVSSRLSWERKRDIARSKNHVIKAALVKKHPKGEVGKYDWSATYFEEAKLLQDRYHVVLPVIDGHSGSDKDFTTIENNADEILSYIDKNCNGKVLMICGLSLGGQILVDLLARRKNICKFAIVESALVLPMKATNALIQPIISMCYPLIKTRWFAQAQFKRY